MGRHFKNIYTIEIADWKSLFMLSALTYHDV